MPKRKTEVTSPKRRTEVAATAPTSGQPRFHMEFKNAAQRIAWGTFQQHDILFLIGPAGTGKAQPLDSIVYTPTGPRTMGKIRVKDKVCTPDGRVATVIGEFPQGEKDIYRIIFSNGDSVECCDEHLWVVSSKSARGWSDKTVNTKYIRENVKSPKGRRNLSIQVPTAVHFQESPTPMSPYLLGLLLGDGGFSGGSLTYSSADTELIESIKNSLVEGYHCVKLECGKYDYAIREKVLSRNNHYISVLRQLGLWGCRSWEKIIPEIYLYNSEAVRLQIVQGLMDTDGTVDKRTGSVSYMTTSEKMADQFKWLIESLGGICTIKNKIKNFKYKGKVKQGRLAFQCSISHEDAQSLFLLKRKCIFTKPRTKYHVKRTIDRVEYVGKKPAKCIMLNAVDGLYLTNHCVVTHNTHLSMAFAIHEILQRKKRQIVLTRPIVEAGESLGFLPGDFSEKVNPYMMPLLDSMKKLIGTQGPQHDLVATSVEIAPLAYMRGRAVTLDTNLITPEGLKPMGAIKLGDEVIGSNGQATMVIGVFPQGKKDIYKVSFSDHTSVRCSGDHLWSTMTLNEKRHDKGFTCKTTLEIKETVKNKHNQKVHRLPVVSAPVEFAPRPITIDPYLLGILLGDGHMGPTAIHLSSVDEEIIEECEKRLPEGTKILHRKDANYSIVMLGRPSRNNTNLLKAQIAELGLLGSRSHNKFIPDSYKFNTTEIRLEILRGLLDTDGCICEHRSGNNRIQYYTTSVQLCRDVEFLVRSLGGMAYSRKREFDETDFHEYKGHIVKHVHASYVIDIQIPLNPFRLSRKADRYGKIPKPVKLIKSVEYVGEEDCQCIQVDAKDHLFLLDDFIVTHNSFADSICIFDEAQNATFNQLKLFLTRIDDNSKIIITGDPGQTDLGEGSGLLDVLHRVDGIPGIGVVKFDKDSIVRHPLVALILEKLDS
jgi:phosphate starvation-inducible PhoH-like protein